MKLVLMLICAVLLSTSAAFATNDKISDKDLQDFLNQKIEQNYYKVYKHYTRGKSQKKEFDAIVSMFEESVKGGLLECVDRTTKAEFVLDVKPTPEAKAIPVYGDEKKFAIPCRTRKVDKIVRATAVDVGDRIKIDVYFIYTSYPDKASKMMDIINKNKNVQYKSKASIRYDLFTEKMILWSFDYSEMDKTDWKRDEWADERDGKMVLVK